MEREGRVHIIENAKRFLCVNAFVRLIKNKHIPTNMDQLMVIPRSFGVDEEDRMDLNIRTMDQVMEVSEKVGEFCRNKGIDQRRSFIASLCMEEMAGNIVNHGFHEDKDKHHSIDIRVAKKDDNLILRLNDDCLPFNPEERKGMFHPEEGPENMGIKLVYGIAKKIEYQNILGLNVLTIRI